MIILMVIQAITTFSYQGTLFWNERKFPDPGWSLLCNHTSYVAGSEGCRLVTALHIAYVAALWEDCTLSLASSSSSFPHKHWHTVQRACAVSCSHQRGCQLVTVTRAAPAGFPKDLTMAFVQSNSERKEAKFYRRGRRKPASPRESGAMRH